MKNKARRSYLGMVSAVDAAIGGVVTALKTQKLWANTVLLLNGDNGGPVWCSR
jgi:arylsulfatase A-like enzyme